MEDSIEYLIDTVFRRSQRSDLQVNLVEPGEGIAQYELENSLACFAANRSPPILLRLRPPQPVSVARLDRHQSAAGN
jgi:hypothetical protein